MYLTPARFKTMAFGTDLTGHSDLELRSVIDQASQLVNTYCAAPSTPVRHDFRGGTVTGEQHRWPLPEFNMASQTSRRVYPLHVPLRSITSFVVKFTNTYQVSVDPANLYVNATEGWAEVVSIAAIVSGVYPVGINFGLYTPIAEVSYTYGWRYAVTNEILSPTDSTIVYQAANQYWATDVTPVVAVNGTTQTTGYSTDPVEGTVTFTTARGEYDVITLSYTYTLPGPIAMATGHLAATLLNEGDLVGKGLGNLAAVRVEEVELRRTYRGSDPKSYIASIDPAVPIYLNDFLYITARA